MDFNKLTLKSQEAVGAAQELARRMGNPEIYDPPRKWPKNGPPPLIEARSSPSSGPADSF